MLEPIQKFKNNFYTVSQSCLRDTDPPYFCKLCGNIKKEFLTPANFNFWKETGGRYIRDPHIIVLDCVCEQEYKTYKSFFENFRDCKTSANIKYAELIDGFVMPKNDAEMNIKKIGLITRDWLREKEIKLSR